MNKEYTTKEMSALLTGIGSHLAEHIGSFPALARVCQTIEVAAQNPGTVPSTSSAPSAAQPVKKKSKVTISYKGENIIVKTPWGQVGRAIKEALNAVVGRKSKTVNPATGEPYFLSCYDKRVKGFKVPSEKKAEAIAAIQQIAGANGLQIEEV